MLSLSNLRALIVQACIARNCYPSPLNYYNFPKSCCTSVNEVICHGIPDRRPLQEGDILNGMIVALDFRLWALASPPHISDSVMYIYSIFESIFLSEIHLANLTLTFLFAHFLPIVMF